MNISDWNFSKGINYMWQFHAELQCSGTRRPHSVMRYNKLLLTIITWISEDNRNGSAIHLLTLVIRLASFRQRPIKICWRKMFPLMANEWLKMINYSRSCIGVLSQFLSFPPVCLPIITIPDETKIGELGGDKWAGHSLKKFSESWAPRLLQYVFMH